MAVMTATQLATHLQPNVGLYYCVPIILDFHAFADYLRGHHGAVSPSLGEAA